MDRSFMTAKLKVETSEPDENKSEQRKYCLGVKFSGVFTEIMFAHWSYETKLNLKRDISSWEKRDGNQQTDRD